MTTSKGRVKEAQRSIADKTTVKAHQRQGTKGVTEHQRKKTQTQKQSELADRLLKQSLPKSVKTTSKGKASDRFSAFINEVGKPVFDPYQIKNSGKDLESRRSDVLKADKEIGDRVLAESMEDDEAFQDKLDAIQDKLAQRFQKIGSGSQRVVYGNDDFVLKAPRDWDGVGSNFEEAEAFAVDKTGKLAESRLVDVDGVPVVAMERLKEPEDYDNLPEWTEDLPDSGQVGYDKQGSLKVYDYGVWDGSRDIWDFIEENEP